ncbi:MAG: M56 family metallopeptidase [Acidobacteriota bacterium]|nr:M56 family metallopeptidase [Acidobacteriota bacterium]
MQPSAIIDALPWAMSAAGDALSAAFSAFSQGAAPILATAFWQGIVVASGLAICLRLAPRMPAAQRFAVWASGFATLVALPFVPLLSHLTFAASNGVAIGAAETSTKPWLQLDMRWSLALAALWLAASVFRAAELALHSFRLRKLWKTATPIEPCISGTSSQGGMRGRMQVQLCTTQELDRPSVIGFFAPRILIPEWLLARLTPEELQQVILHEAEHLRRGDDWTNLFQKLCLVLFPLDPALWWIERRLCQEREMACDEGVVRVTRAPHAYAACLANLAERGLQHRAEALSLGAWRHRPELAQRVHRILQRRNALNPLATRALLGVLGCALLFTSVELARCPQLVAFVPARTAGSAQAAATTTSQAGTPRLISAAYTPVRKTAATTRGFRATQANALVARSSETRGASASYAAAAWKASSSQRAASSPQHMMNVAFAGSPSGSADEQQWIVLTAWDQVDTASHAARTSADYDTVESADPITAPASVQPGDRVTGQITVTRLIFKFLPAGSTSAQPVAVPVRSGWFVIQL